MKQLHKIKRPKFIILNFPTGQTLVTIPKKYRSKRRLNKILSKKGWKKYL